MFGTGTRLGHRTLRQIGSGSSTGRGKPAGDWVSHCKVQVVSTYSRVLFDGKFHQAVVAMDER